MTRRYPTSPRWSYHRVVASEADQSRPMPVSCRRRGLVRDELEDARCSVTRAGARTPLTGNDELEAERIPEERAARYTPPGQGGAGSGIAYRGFRRTRDPLPGGLLTGD